MTRTNHVVRPLALGVILLLNVVLLTGTSMAQKQWGKLVQFYPAATKAIPLAQSKLNSNLSAEERAQCLSQLGVANGASETTPRREDALISRTGVSVIRIPSQTHEPTRWNDQAGY